MIGNIFTFGFVILIFWGFFSEQDCENEEKEVVEEPNIKKMKVNGKWVDVNINKKS